MIKILFSLPLFVSVFISRAQTGPHQVSLDVSNNEQLSQVSDDFYFRYENMMAIFSPGKTLAEDHFAFKTMLGYSYRTVQKLEMGLNCGFGMRKNNYQTDVSDIEASQRYFSLLPFVLKVWEFRELQLAIGGGVPIHLAGTFKASYSEHSNWLSSDIIADNTLDGGSAIGISAIGRVRWFFTPRFAVSGTVNYGVLYSNFGGDFNVAPTADSYPVYFNTRTRRQSGISLPAPELSVGLTFHI